MSHVQFALAVSDDIRLAQKTLIGGEWVGLGAAVRTRDISRVVVSL
jgi:hypothetical protein